jgi:predicted nucleotide-binding protein
MARRSTPPPPDRPRLLLPLAEAEGFLLERMRVGQEIAAEDVRSPGELSGLRQRYYTWTEFNEEWLRRYVGASVAEEYAYVGPMFAMGDSSLADDTRDFRSDVAGKVRRLESVKERLPLWVDEAASSASGRTAAAAHDGPIFVVHGSDLGRAHEVTRILDRATTRDAVILHEQANAGATVLEKFERHAVGAGFAVVILTADDEGRRRGDGDLLPRGRQNVIFELGFFFGLLGRGRVAVLLEPEVEQPSDIHGLVYIALDAAGAWKLSLAKELESAGIVVNRSRIL